MKEQVGNPYQEEVRAFKLRIWLLIFPELICYAVNNFLNYVSKLKEILLASVVLLPVFSKLQIYLRTSAQWQGRDNESYLAFQVPFMSGFDLLCKRAYSQYASYREEATHLLHPGEQNSGMGWIDSRVVPSFFTLFPMCGMGGKDRIALKNNVSLVYSHIIDVLMKSGWDNKLQSGTW